MMEQESRLEVTSSTALFPPQLPGHPSWSWAMVDLLLSEKCVELFAGVRASLWVGGEVYCWAQALPLSWVIPV